MIENLQWFDHAIVALFTIGLGGGAYFKIDGFIRRVLSGAHNARVKEYRRTIINQWCLTTLAAVCWFALANRSAADLGLSLNSNWQLWTGVGATILGLAFFWWQRATVRGSEEVRQLLREQLSQLEVLVPHSAAEFRWFIGVSFTAGICEEILYRGYLLAYLSVWMPAWLAATVAVVAFGVAHSYQMKITKGSGNVIRTMIFGAVAMGLYCLADSLWCSIVLHVAVDYQTGYLAYLIYGQSPPGRIQIV